jgi:hypothetical protein
VGAPTDLIARHSANAAGRGLDFQAELARRTRTPRIGMQASSRGSRPSAAADLGVRARTVTTSQVSGLRGLDELTVVTGHGPTASACRTRSWERARTCLPGGADTMTTTKHPRARRG